jgi:hypothetical protein
MPVRASSLPDWQITLFLHLGPESRAPCAPSTRLGLRCRFPLLPQDGMLKRAGPQASPRLRRPRLSPRLRSSDRWQRGRRAGLVGAGQLLAAARPSLAQHPTCAAPSAQHFHLSAGA